MALSAGAAAAQRKATPAASDAKDVSSDLGSRTVSAADDAASRVKSAADSAGSGVDSATTDVADGSEAMVETEKDVASEADDKVAGVADHVWAPLGPADAENVKADEAAVTLGASSGLKLSGGVAASALSAGINAAKQASASDDKEDKENKNTKSVYSCGGGSDHWKTGPRLKFMEAS